MHFFDTLTSILSNLSVCTISVFTFWITYWSKDVKVTSFTPGKSVFEGLRYDVTIFNKTLQRFFISKICMVVNNKYILYVKEFDDAFALDRFHTVKIPGDRFSNSREVSEKVGYGKDIYFILEQANGEKIYSKFKGKREKNKEKELEVITRYSLASEKGTVEESVKYELTITNRDGKQDHILILGSGWMDTTINNFNAIPSEDAASLEKVSAFFKSQFKNPDLFLKVKEIKTSEYYTWRPQQDVKI